MPNWKQHCIDILGLRISRRAGEVIPSILHITGFPPFESNQSSALLAVWPDQPITFCGAVHEAFKKRWIYHYMIRSRLLKILQRLLWTTWVSKDIRQLAIAKSYRMTRTNRSRIWSCHNVEIQSQRRLSRVWTCRWQDYHMVSLYPQISDAFSPWLKDWLHQWLAADVETKNDD